MCRKLVSLVVLFSLSVVSIAYAGLTEGAVAYSKGDYPRALMELEPLAQKGNSDAQWYMGVMFHDGQGVDKDYAEAVKWFRKAAEQGHVRGEFNLGVMYRRGNGVKQDNAEAVKWYYKAAERGLAEAQLNLGGMYAEGQGVPQDYVEAYKWLDLAAASGDLTAKKNRDITAAQMTPAQIAEAQRLAREWKPK